MLVVTQNKMSKVRCAPGEVLVAFVSEFHEKPWVNHNNYLKRLKMKLAIFLFVLTVTSITCQATSEVECTSTVCRKCLAVFQRAFNNFNCEKPCSRCIFCTGYFVDLPLCKQYCMNGGVKGCSSRCEKGKSVCKKCCSGAESL